jgi:L-fuconolactonase
VNPGRGAEPRRARRNSSRPASPIIETCIADFGLERPIFESNFPVDKGSCSYAALWNAFKRIAAGCSASEKAAPFRVRASKFYRLGQMWCRV